MKVPAGKGVFATVAVLCMPSCSLATPQNYVPDTKIGSVIDILFGDQEIIPPLANIDAEIGSSSIQDPACDKYQISRLSHKLRLPTFPSISVNAVCGSAIDPDLMGNGQNHNQSFIMVYMIGNILPQVDVSIDGYQRYRHGYFLNNHTCVLMVKKNPAGNTIGSVIMIQTDKNDRFSFGNSTQSECYARASLVAIGFVGASSISTEKIIENIHGDLGNSYTKFPSNINPSVISIMNVIYRSMPHSIKDKMIAREINRSDFISEIKSSPTASSIISVLP